MSELRRRFMVFCALILGFCCQTGNASDVVSTCLDYTPYTEDDTGGKNWNGRNIETLYVMTQKLGVHLDMSMRAPFARCMRLLEQGRIDIIAGLIYTEERDQKLLLIPYSEKTQLAIFYLKSRITPVTLDYLSLSDTIGVHLAFAIPENLKDTALMEHISPIPSVGTGLQMLLKKRLTGVLSGLDNGTQIISEYDDFKDQFDYTLLDNSGNKSVHFAIHPDSPLAARQAHIKNTMGKMAKNPQYAHLGL